MSPPSDKLLGKIFECRLQVVGYNPETRNIDINYNGQRGFLGFDEFMDLVAKGFLVESTLSQGDMPAPHGRRGKI